MSSLILNNRVAVFGDIMLDYNIYTNITKIANEAPIPVFQFINSTYYLGGAGNVLKNLAAIGCKQVYAFGIVGNDNNASILKALFKDNNIIDYTNTINNYNTIIKQRYFADNKIVFRCDTESNKSTVSIDMSAICLQFELLCQKGLDCVVLSDYNKGFLTKELCQAVIQISNRYNIHTIVDPKEDYNKYIGCTLIKPNRKEAYSIFNIPISTSLKDAHLIIKSSIGCKYSIITLAENGISVSTSTDLIKTTTSKQQTIDVTGAGDIVTAIFASLIETETPIGIISNMATQIATLSVQYSGTYTIHKKDIYRYQLNISSKIIELHQLSMLNTIYSDKKIVFTNGCFDILHDGHIEIFKFCKQQGDIVVVGLNSDASIKRLKGPSRPIHKETTRLEILKAITYIDYIIVFEEDTPEELIKALRPYFLIKGGDYTPETIIGAQYANTTIVCPLVANMSTTNTINKISNYK